MAFSLEIFIVKFHRGHNLIMLHGLLTLHVASSGWGGVMADHESGDGFPSQKKLVYKVVLTGGRCTVIMYSSWRGYVFSMSCAAFVPYRSS